MARHLNKLTMDFLNKYLGNLFLTNRFYSGILCCIIFFIADFFLPLGSLPIIFFQSYLLLFFIDYFFLFLTGKKATAKRIVSERLSNGDDNNIQINVSNGFPFTVDVEVIDELPEQFQIRDFNKKIRLKSNQQKKINYTVKPVERGEYFPLCSFVNMNCFHMLPYKLKREVKECVRLATVWSLSR